MNINFEADKQDSLTKVNDAKSLSEQVLKLKVEPMTLKALVRERLEAGQEMPTDLFNVFAGNRTKITRK
jgi:hypothetical protein